MHLKFLISNLFLLTIASSKFKFIHYTQSLHLYETLEQKILKKYSYFEHIKFEQFEIIVENTIKYTNWKKEIRENKISDHCFLVQFIINENYNTLNCCINCVFDLMDMIFCYMDENKKSTELEIKTFKIPKYKTKMICEVILKSISEFKKIYNDNFMKFHLQNQFTESIIDFRNSFRMRPSINSDISKLAYIEKNMHKQDIASIKIKKSTKVYEIFNSLGSIKRNKEETRYIIIIAIQIEFFLVKYLSSIFNGKSKIYHIQELRNFLELIKNELIRLVDYREKQFLKIKKLLNGKNFSLILNPRKSDTIIDSVRFLLERVYNFEKIKIQRVINFIKQANLLFYMCLNYIITKLEESSHLDIQCDQMYLENDSSKAQETFEIEIKMLISYFHDMIDVIPEYSFVTIQDSEESN